MIGLTSAGSGTLIALVLIAVFRLTPQRVVGTDVFHAAVLLWAAGLAHWVGGNVDLGLAGQHPRRLDPRACCSAASSRSRSRPASCATRSGVVMIASAITLIAKEHVPPAVLIPSLSVAALVIGALFAFQIGLHRQRSATSDGQARAAAARAAG